VSHFKRLFGQLPVPSLLQVRVRLPEGRKAKKVQLLAAGVAPRVQESAGVISVTMPSVLDHEVVAIDL
jgi:hypothetical protein